MKTEIKSLNTYSKIILESASQLKYDLVIIFILGGIIFLLTGTWLVCQIPLYQRDSLHYWLFLFKLSEP